MDFPDIVVQEYLVIQDSQDTLVILEFPVSLDTLVIQVSLDTMVSLDTQVSPDIVVSQVIAEYLDTQVLESAGIQVPV